MSRHTPASLSPSFLLSLLLSLAIFSHPANASTLTWLGDVDGTWSSGTNGSNTNWISNTLPTNGDSLVFDLTTAGVTNLANNFAGLTPGGTNAITFTNDTLTGSGFTVTGNAVTLGGNIISSGVTGTHTHTLSLDLILSGTRTVNSAVGTAIVIDGTISESGGSFGFTKAGGGAATLNGANTFTGAFSVNQGALTISSIADGGTASAIGAGTVMNFGNAAQTGTLIYTGNAASTNRTLNLASASTGGAVIDASGTGALIFAGAFTNTGSSNKTLTLNGTAISNEIQSVLTNGSSGGVLSVTKGDTGSWILSGLNTFTGAASINRASLSINSIADGGAASALGAGTTLNLGNGAQGGTLIYTGTTASTNRSIILASTSTGGGTITSNGSGALVFTGSFSNTGSGAKTFTLGGSNTGANEFQAALVDNGGGALSFVKTGSGAWTLSGTSTFTGAFSVNQGTLTISSLANSGANSAAGAGATINLGSGTTAAGILIYTGPGDATNRAVNLAATTTGAATINSSGSGALIFSGVFSNSGTGTKTFTLAGSSSDNNEIQSVIADGSGTLALTKADAGTWVLSAENTYSGVTTLNAGTLVLNSSSAIGTGTLTITGGTLDNTSGSAITLSTNNAIALNGSLAFGGTNSLNLGNGVVTIGNGNREITLNGDSTFTLGEVQWNSVAGTRVFTVSQGAGNGAKLVLGGFQLNVNADTAARNRTITGTGDVGISGAVVNGNAFNNGLIYSSSGTLTLSGANTYTGVTIVNGGTLELSGSGTIATSSALTLNAGTFDVGGTSATVSGTLTLGAATTTIAGQSASIISSVAGGSFTLGGNVTYNTGTAGFENGQATISADLALTADRTFTINDSPNADVDVLVSGAISGGFGIIKGSAGTLRLSGTNTFSGQAQLNNGVTEVTSLGNIGVAGSLGTADKDTTSGIIRLGNAASTGTLNYLGDGDSTNRRVQIGSGNGATATGGAAILNNGSAALVFTSATVNSAVTVSATGTSTPRVLTLGGSNTDANTLQGVIINNTGAGTSGTNAIALMKQDAGLWILAGSSSYSGGTTVDGGTLVVNNVSGSATGSGSVLIGNAARLGGSGTAGSLSAGASMTQQSGGVIYAGQSGVLDAQTLTLQAGAGFSLSGSIELDIIGGGNDRIVFSGGTIALAGATLSIHTSLPLTSSAWTAGSSWKLIDWSGVTGSFDNLPASDLTHGNASDLPDLSALGLGWDWSQLYTNGTLSVMPLAPEPSRTLFSLLGAILSTMRRRRTFLNPTPQLTLP
jgi:fibronectin-binding autotransporter adhesin